MSASTRDQALDAARRIILEEGLGALSMRRVAGEVDVTAAALYRHFASKEALVWLVVGEGYGKLIHSLSRALGAPTPVERFVESGRAYIDFAIEQPGYYTLVFGSTMRDLGNEDIPEITRVRGAAALQILVDRVRECMDAGLFVTDEPRSVALYVWSTVHGLASLRLAHRLAELDPAAFDAERERCLGRIVRSLMR